MEFDASYRRTGESCEYCGGNLYRNIFHAICEDCSGAFIEQETPMYHPMGPDPVWEKFQESRPRYYSGKAKCVGGFLRPYDWVEDELVTVDEFYL